MFWKKKKKDDHNEQQPEGKQHSPEEHIIPAVPEAAAQAKEPNIEQMKEVEKKAAEHIAHEKPQKIEKKEFSLFKRKEDQKPGKLAQFASDSKRVLRVAKKPTLPEYKTSFKITGIGVIIIGAIGMAIFLVFRGLFGV